MHKILSVLFTGLFALMLGGWFPHGAISPVLTAIPNAYFGMTVGAYNHIPDTNGQWTVGSFAKYPATSWSYIQPTSLNADGQNCTPTCSYTWTTLDNIANVARARGITMYYTIAGATGSPGWVVANHAAGTGQVNSTTGQWTTNLPPDDLASIDTFLAALVTRYSDVLDMVECWSEPQNLIANGMTAANLVIICNRIHDWLRANAPTIKIGTPSIQPRDDNLHAGYFYWDYFTAGGTQDVDVISWHGYSSFSLNAGTPEGKPGSPGYPNGSTSSVLGRYTSMVNNIITQFGGLTGKAVWDTEWGWGLNANYTNTDNQQAFVSRSLILHYQHMSNGSPATTQSSWYSYGIAGWGGLVSNFSTYPLNSAGVSYQQTYLWMHGAQVNICTASGTVWSCVIQRNSPANYKGLIVWDTGGSSTFTVPSNVPAYTQYRNTAGTVTSTTTGVGIVLPLGSGGTATIGTTPIIIETAQP